MPYFYVLPNRIVQSEEGSQQFPEWPVGGLPGRWVGFHYVDSTYNAWLVATRDDLGLPYVKTGYGRYGENSKDFDTACAALKRNSAEVKSWTV